MIIWFDDPQPDPLQIGGKGFHLSRMVQAGLPVPLGFCISTDSVASIGVEEIAGALQRLGAASVAVRSSAIDEDSSTASFAGIFATRLNVKTAAEVVQALGQIQQSASAAPAAQYRAHRGISQGDRIAAVVQSFVDARVSGVVFMRNPVDRSQNVVIEASWGLGEALVGGLVTPDHWELSRDGEIVTTRIGAKDVTVISDASGVRRVETEPACRKLSCLEQRELRELVKLGGACEDLFQEPQEIEWAIDAAQIWLLQSRPITTR